MNEQFNVRLPGYTLEQVDLLCSTYGLTKTQVTILAFDRLTLALDPERIGFNETQDILKVVNATSHEPRPFAEEPEQEGDEFRFPDGEIDHSGAHRIA